MKICQVKVTVTEPDARPERISTTIADELRGIVECSLMIIPENDGTNTSLILTVLGKKYKFQRPILPRIDAGEEIIIHTHNKRPIAFQIIKDEKSLFRVILYQNESEFASTDIAFIE